MATDANQDLSLGKLRRAVDGNDSYTAESKLGEDAGGTTSADSDVGMSNFSISAVSATLSGSKHQDEGTAETVTMEFSDAGSRFISRIAGRSENFTWAKNNAVGSGTYTLESGDYTATGTAGAISSVDTANIEGDGVRGTFHAAHTGDWRVGISASFHEDGQSDGYNDHATRYNTAIKKKTQVEDVYDSVAITCFTPDTEMLMADGTSKQIQDVFIGDEIVAMTLPNDVEDFKDYSVDSIDGLEQTTAKVVNMFFDFADEYYIINGDIKVTGEHPIFIQVPEGFYVDVEDSSEFYCWEYVVNLKVGQIMYNKNLNEVPIDVIEKVEKEIEIVNVDVDGPNTYFAGGVLVHNKGAASVSDTGDGIGHSFTEDG